MPDALATPGLWFCTTCWGEPVEPPTPWPIALTVGGVDGLVVALALACFFSFAQEMQASSPILPVQPANGRASAAHRPSRPRRPGSGNVV